jgi:hypothetical protein
MANILDQGMMAFWVEKNGSIKFPTVDHPTKVACVRGSSNEEVILLLESLIRFLKS